jgi:hypothetical protein
VYPTPNRSASESVPGVNRVSFDIKDETELAVRHWETEHIGILPDENKQQSDLEKSAIDQHRNMTKKTDERYETGLPRHQMYQTQTLKSYESLVGT